MTTKMFVEDPIENFSTRDISLAATLLFLNFDLVNIDYQIEGTKRNPVGYFQFRTTSELNEIVGKYWSKQLSVEPQTFSSSIRALKSQINEKYNSPHSKF